MQVAKFLYIRMENLFNTQHSQQQQQTTTVRTTAARSQDTRKQNTVT